MALPEIIKKKVQKKIGSYCKNKIPEHAKAQVRMSYKIRGNYVTIFEERPYFLDPEKWTARKIAQLRYDPENIKWTLYYSDRNGRWHKYDKISPTSDLTLLIKELDEDITGVFWG